MPIQIEQNTINVRNANENVYHSASGYILGSIKDIENAKQRAISQINNFGSEITNTETINDMITLEIGGIDKNKPNGGSNKYRVYTKDIIEANDYMLIEVDEGYICWVFSYNSDGELIGTTSERQLNGPAKYVMSPRSRFRLVFAILAYDDPAHIYKDFTENAELVSTVLQHFRIYKPKYTLALYQEPLIPEWTSTAIFQTIGVIGDSWASGSMYHPDDPTGKAHTGNKALSWPQILGRMCGITVTNFTHGGYDTNMWLSRDDGLAALKSDSAKQLYIIALGINDCIHSKEGYDGNYPLPLGDMDDIKEDYAQNPVSFFGCYGRIIREIQAKSADAKLILMSVARPTERVMDQYIQQIAEYFSLPYIYLPDDLFFHSQDFYNHIIQGHLLSYGYGGMATAIHRLLIKCILEHPDYFGTYYGTDDPGESDIDD